MGEYIFRVAQILRISINQYSLHVAIKSSLKFSWFVLTTAQVALMKAIAGVFTPRRVHYFLKFNSLMFFVSSAFWWI